jgi:hypothetical protein
MYICTCPTHIIEAQNPRYKEAGTSVYLQEHHSMVMDVHINYKVGTIQELL